ncbi:MAG: ABC transporter ATP-binding protein [Pseudomonadota bacterium]
MTQPAIQVRGLGKRFRIGAKQAPYKRLTEVVTEMALAPLRRLQQLGKPVPADEEIWALKDVSFDVMPGEVVGVIGRNGAGKSTLLKILSRITEPTVGEARIHGRVGSLLEVGTGFHPELTGRENIFLNGAILGMHRAEIRKKFDEIVAFAEIDKFIDTPVKRYSSGMYVRLAFAVAAHLETDILFVDEVLAVGDVAFQKKCLGKMGDVARGGRTVMFVSHNLNAVTRICQRSFWIEGGLLRQQGISTELVRLYLESSANSSGAVASSAEFDFVIGRVCVLDPSGRETRTLQVKQDITIEVHYRAGKPIALPHFWIGLASETGNFCGANMLLDGLRPLEISGDGCLRCVFEKPMLLPQTYYISLGARDQSGRHFLIPTASQIGTFRIAGGAADLDMHGIEADGLIEHSAPVLLPYHWVHPDGTIHVPGWNRREEA